jgi:hypothetical protein
MIKLCTAGMTWCFAGRDRSLQVPELFRQLAARLAFEQVAEVLCRRR